jgi:predicted tellurium resistance membrane protein TerC
MHLTRPAANDLASRVEQLERVLQESRARLPGSMAAILLRIKRLTALVQSSLVRSDPDEVDCMTMQLLLADYAHVVQELRASAKSAADTLKAAANSVAHTERIVRGDPIGRE